MQNFHLELIMIALIEFVLSYYTLIPPLETCNKILESRAYVNTHLFVLNSVDNGN